MPTKAPGLRSREWLDTPELYGWLRRAALRSQGFGEQLLDNRPIIGICMGEPVSEFYKKTADYSRLNQAAPERFGFRLKPIQLQLDP